MYRSGLSIRIALSLVFVSLFAAEAVALDEGPPPLPTQADHQRFIAEHGASHLHMEKAPAPLWVHDEYDVTHYDVTMSLDIDNSIVYGTTVAEITSEAVDLTQIDIDLYPCLTADAVLVNGSPAFFMHNDQTLTITLDGTYQPGETFSVSGTYHGTPSFPGQPLPFRFMTQNGMPMVLSYSEPYGAPAWWMCDDDPKDKATLDLHFEVPEDLFVVSTGLLTAIDDNGDGTKTYHWETDYQMSTYLFSIAVTNFASWTEVYTALDGFTTMDVDYYAYPADLADAQESWNRNVEMMEYYRTLFGEYPFLDEKYAIAEFHHGGAMEHQTATSMGWQWVNGNHQYDWIVAHELCHSWVGDLITMTSWDHTWTKEGFATICEAFWFEHLFGHAYYHTYMNNMNVLPYAVHQLYGINPPLHGAIYYKGAWVLHMLRHVLGDTDFFNAIYDYANDPAFMYGVADTDDMRAVFETVSGTDLVWFFDEWIYSPGYPVYEYGWSSTPVATGFDVEIDITQVQTLGPIFKMPIDVDIETDQGTERFVIWDSLETQSFVLHVEGMPQDVVLDPDDWIIKRTQVSGTPGVGDAGVIALNQNRPNPFNPETWITYHLRAPSDTRLVVYDAAGRRIRSLVDGWQPAGAGSVAWDGRDALGRPVSAGVYFYRLDTSQRSIGRQMVLAK